MSSIKKSIDVKGTNNEIIIASGASINDISVVIRGNGNKLILAQGTYAAGTFELMGDNNIISIGAGGTIFKTFMSAHDGKKIIIGSECLFANPTDIRTSDYHPVFDIDNKHLNPSQDVIIGDRVWLTRQVNVLKGSTIENDVVVGVGAVVTGHIPANSVAVGVPAKVIRTGITWRHF